MLSLPLQRAPAHAGLSVGIFCLYTSLLTDEEIDIFQAAYRASGIGISARHGSEVNLLEKFTIGAE